MQVLDFFFEILNFATKQEVCSFVYGWAVAGDAQYAINQPYKYQKYGWVGCVWLYASSSILQCSSSTVNRMD